MTPEAEQRRRVAMHRLRERARRITLIRKGVVAGAVATFVLAWGLALGSQLAHGTRTSPGDASGQSGDDGEQTAAATPQAPTYVYEDGVAVPTQPAPAPAPLTTSQS